MDDYLTREGKPPEPLENCLLRVESLDEAKRLTLEKIRALAANPGAADARLVSLLFAWRDIAGQSDEVRAWTARKMQTPEGVGELAAAFTSESWSQGLGMFGLGDHVAVRSYRATYEGLDGVIDVDQFKQRIDSLQAEELEEPVKSQVGNFVEGLKARGF
jgi:uncharacterized membrane-anchored protein